jgi:hypothetical protein
MIIQGLSAFAGCFWTSTIGVCRMDYRRLPDVFSNSPVSFWLPNAKTPTCGTRLQSLLQILIC